MKKIFIALLSFCLIFVLAMSGCSCSPETLLEFNDSLTANIKAEKLVYDVSFERAYKDIQRSKGINESLLPVYENGTFTIEYDGAGKALPDGVQTNVNFDNISTFKYIKSVLEIDVTVSGKTFNDKIVSEVYFYPSEWAYAPVYSTTTIKNTYIALDSTRVAYSHNIYKYTTTYSTDKYVLTKQYYDEADDDVINSVDIFNMDEAKLKSISGNSNSHEYSLRRTIDNNQLLFTIRNLNLNKEESKLLLATTFLYDEPRELLMINESETNINLTELNYNGTIKNDLVVPVKNIEFGLTGTNYIGASKYVCIQKSKVDTIENNAIPIEYAEGIVENHSYSTIGALVYKLREVSIVNK